MTVYVTVAFGVPVNVTVADPFGQTVVLLAIATVGGGITVITIDPVNGRVQAGEPDETILIRLKVVVAVKVFVIVAVPDPFKTTVWLAPPLML